MDVPSVAVSTDGRGWDVRKLKAPNGGALADIAVTAQGLVAVGSTMDADGAPQPAAWTSRDGSAWTPAAAGQFGDVPASLREVATVGSALVTVGYEPSPSDDSPGPMRAWWSTDGLRWEPSTAPADWDAVLNGDLSPGPAGAVLVGTPRDGNTPRAWVSADGRRWKSQVLPTQPDTDSSFAADIASDGARYVAVGDDVNFAEDLGPASGRPAIWTSADALSWRLVPRAELDGPALKGNADAVRVLPGDGRWLVYGTTSAGADLPHTWILWSGQPATLTSSP